MPTFTWITWEAAATLITGFLAVGAALMVGLRQSKIARKQADIQEDQAAIQREQTRIQEELRRLEELKLRTELFERRVAVYDATREWIGWIVAYATPPGFQVDGQPLTEEAIGVRRNFYRGVDRARFLFRPEVFRTLEKLSKDGLALKLAQRRALTARKQESRDMALDKENEILDRIGALDRDLSRVFGDELSLSVHGTAWEFDREGSSDHEDESVAAESGPEPAAPTVRTPD
jgi:hypothetical protein